MQNALLRLKNQNRSLYFAGTFILLFCIFYFFNLFYIGITSPGKLYSPWLDNHFNYIRGLRHLLLAITAWALELMGYSTFTNDTLLHIKGHGGIILVYSCLGFGVMSFFTAFVIAWPKPIKSKLWFLPMGLLLIQGLNILRFMLIAIYGNRKLAAMGIDHHNAFNIVLYVVLLFSLYWWLNKQPGSHRRGQNTQT